jgi:hypothetical protein
MRGVPRHNTLRRSLKQADVGALYIVPAGPWETGYAKIFHGC